MQRIEDHGAGRPRFDVGLFLVQIAATRAQFLVRLGFTRRLPVMARLEDGSFLSRIGELSVRVIEGERQRAVR